jgi:cobalamin biosynthesis protein CbiG
MDFNAPTIGIYIRVVAIISLLLGLNDAARLLGVNLGAVSPIATMGVTGFIYLGIFSAARLFAAVGLWIKASWGAVLLVGATGVELLLYLLGNPDVRMSAIGFAVRLVLLASILIIFVLSVRMNRQRVVD